MSSSQTPLENICDCHVHVFESPDRYPFAMGRTYTPGIASLDELKKLHAALGVSRTVIVQASPHGTDNSCMLDALDKLDGTGRGVVVLDDDITRQDLQKMHARGVRGVRVNLETAGQHDPAFARNSLLRAAQTVADLGWHVQTYTNLTVFAELLDILPNLPCPLVIDHFGKPDAALGTGQAGLRELCDALSQGLVYVKLSAPYRISRLPDYSDVEPIAKALINANPDRTLWGSDWPHPGAAGGSIRPLSEITPFRDENNVLALNRAIGWTTNPEQRQKLLCANAESLYDF